MFGITLAAESYIPDLVIDRNFLQFNLGIAGAVAGNLLVLRLLGLKLFSVVQQGAPSSADRENPVKPPHFQFQPAARQETGAAGS